MEEILSPRWLLLKYADASGSVGVSPEPLLMPTDKKYGKKFGGLGKYS